LALDVVQRGDRQPKSPSGWRSLERVKRYANPLQLPLWLWLVVIGITYGIFLPQMHKGLGPTSTAYYNGLLSAFRHGQTNLAVGNTYDLSQYNGKWYLYWGASPVLFILPFYAISHLQTSDVVYGCAAGILNVVVFSGCVREFVRHFQIKANRFSQIFVILNFAFVSPNFYLSLGGTIWYVNQVIAVFYLLLYYYFFLRFLNDRRLPYLFLAAVFFGLAWNARLSLLFHGVLFLYLFVVLLQKDRAMLWRALGVTAAVSIVTLGWFFGYNLARFGNALEIGYRFQIPAERFRADFAANRLFSLSHIPHNATYYFLNNVVLKFEVPYLQIEEEGNSIFSVYPLVILAFLFLKRNIYVRRNWLFLCIFGFGLGINLLAILMNLGTGWTQFGSRYFFDVVPGLFLLILFVVEEVSVPWRLVLLLYGMYVNFLGSLLFYHAIQWKV
jgi:hypothetical protein